MGMESFNIGGIFLRTPEDVLTAAGRYFAHCKDNPILEEVVVNSKMGPVHTTNSKIRAVTKQGFCVFVGLSVKAYERYRSRGEDWADALDMVDDAIYAHKYEHAVVGVFSASVVSRDLGLAERTEVTGRNGGPMEVVQQAKVDAEEFLKRMNSLVEKACS